MLFRVPIDTRPANLDDKPAFGRKAISNYDGFKRLDRSLEKIELRDRAREKVCDVCQRHCRAWRIVPATFGTVLRGTPFRGPVVVACDAGPEGCAESLIRAGVADDAVSQQEAKDRLERLCGLVLP